MRTLFALAAALFASTTGAAQTFGITNGRIITAGPQGTIDNGTVIVRDGRIAAIGTAIAIPPGIRMIDAGGKIVAPGFISVASGIGLKDTMEIDDTIPAGVMGSSSDIALAFNPSNGAVRTNLLEGSTTAIIAPAVAGAAVAQGRPFGGKAAAVELSGSFDFLIKSNLAVVLDLSKNEDIAGRAATIPLVQAMLAQARLPAHQPDATTAQIAAAADIEALRPVAAGTELLLIDVERASDILNVLKLARDEHIRIALVGASEGWLVARQIAAAKVPVILAGDLNTPVNFQQLNATYQNAQRLAVAGVPIAILPQGTPGAARNFGPVRYVAGRTVGYGLDWTTAIKAITSMPAQIFGLAGEIGSIEVGRRADLVIWDGDPLEVTSDPVAIFVRGVTMPLESHQTMLRDKFARMIK